MNNGEIGTCLKCGKAVDVHVLPGDRAQYRVLDAVRRRGYMDGWSAGQFARRQGAKLMEEMVEVLAPLLGGEISMHDLSPMAFGARMWFDHGEWPEREISEELWFKVREEAADVLVVLFNLVETINQITNSDYDLVSEALKKAEGDIQRGVR